MTFHSLVGLCNQWPTGDTTTSKNPLCSLDPTRTYANYKKNAKELGRGKMGWLQSRFHYSLRFPRWRFARLNSPWRPPFEFSSTSLSYYAIRNSSKIKRTLVGWFLHIYDGPPTQKYTSFFHLRTQTRTLHRNHRQTILCVLICYGWPRIDSWRALSH